GTGRSALRLRWTVGQGVESTARGTPAACLPPKVTVNLVPAPQLESPTRHTPHSAQDLREEPSYPLWVRLRAGDLSARDELVVRYAPLVKFVIGRMAISLPAAMDSDDVLSAGTIGLLHAVDRFDPDQGVRFETYGLQRIRGAIIDTI